MNWRVQLLGGLALNQGSQVITHFESTRAALLLAYLALSPQRSHPREELCELLWPEIDIDISRPRLRQALYSLRHQLEPPGVPSGSVLIADRHSLRLNPAAVHCDATDFERLVRMGRYTEARVLYAGDLLPGYYDDWVLQERYRLADLHDSLPPTPLAAPEDEREQTRAEALERPQHICTPLPARLLTLPAYLTDLLGREIEQQRLVAQLTYARLLTLTGLGGVGKTRLAVSVGREVSVRYDAVVFVPLADTAAPMQLLEMIRFAMGLPASSAPPLEQIGTAFADSQVLLILDNFEHLVEAGGGAIVETLLARLPGLTCLVTSRRVLGVPGEEEFLLVPLPLPSALEPLTELARNPAIALFVRRAQAVRPGFHLTEHNRADLLTLCCSLEGVPLALELAAGRIRALTPAEMQTQIQDRFAWLVRLGPGADKEPRQRSLWAALEWSWRLLSPRQQRFLSILSVFRGGWTAEVAADVCEAHDARERLEALTMDSLVVSEETSAGTTRFHMLEMVRAFVRERLGAGATLACRRHRAAFLAIAIRSEAEGSSLLAEAENLAAALETAIESADAETAFSLCVAVDERWPALTGLSPALALMRRALQLPDGNLRARMETLRLVSYFTALAGGHAEAWELTEQATRTAGSRPVERAIALIAQCHVGLAGYRTEDFVSRLQEALVLARKAGEPKIVGRALHLLGMIANRRGDFAEAKLHLAEALDVLESGGDRHGVSAALDSLANTAVQSGDLERALELYALCQDRAAAFGNVFYEAKIYQNLATVYARQERWQESLTAGRECIRRSHALGNDYIILFALWNLAEPLTYVSREATAAQLVSFTARVWTEQFGPLNEQDASYFEMIREQVASTLGAVRTEELRRAGERLSLSQAVVLALLP
jgi:predicted ATPase